MLNYLEKHGLKKDTDRNLAYYCIKDYYYRLKYAKETSNIEALKILDNIKIKILEKEFGKFDFEKYKCLILGGFSLRWEIQKATFALEDLKEHYCFSSLISVMSKYHAVRVQHENSFRRQQIENDINSKLLEEIKNLGREGLIFVDFLEERYDVMEIDEGKYLTLSDAFVEAEKEEIVFKRIIKWGTSEYMFLWKKSCLNFIAYLKKYLSNYQVIYVANRMAMYYGDFNELKLYKNWKHLSLINEKILEMEKFFIKNFDGIIQIKPNNKFVFTDKNFRLGCDPQYMNNIYYSTIGVNIFSKIMEIGMN